MSASFDVDLDAEDDNGVDIDLDAELPNGPTGAELRATPEQLAAEATRKATGKRVQFETPTDRKAEFEGAWLNDDLGAVGDVAAGTLQGVQSMAPFTDRTQLPTYGEKGVLPFLANTTSGAIRNAAGFTLGSATPAGPFGGAAVVAADRASQIENEMPGGLKQTFSESPIATTADLALSGASSLTPPGVKNAVYDAATGFGQGVSQAVEEGADLTTLEGLKDAGKQGLINTLLPLGISVVKPVIKGAKRVAGLPEPKAQPISTEGQVIPDELRAREGQGQAATPETIAQPKAAPTGVEGPVIRSSPGPEVAQGNPAKEGYTGGYNDRLFGMEENPDLKPIYKEQGLRMGEMKGSKTRAEVAEAAAKLPELDEARLAKVDSLEAGRSFSDEETQALSDFTAGFADKRLAGPLSPEDQAKFDLYSKAAKYARGARAQSLSMLNQSAVKRLVEQKNYRAAALSALDEIDPSGKAPESAIKAIREMPDDPLEMARTVFRESRRYHGVLQNIITGNLLSNVFGTAPINMASNVMNLMAETAGRRPTEYGAATAGALRGSKNATKRTGFAFKEGFAREALNDPRVAAEAPGFAFGGALNPLNLGGRTAFAGDEFIKGVAEQSHIDVMAKAMTKERGLKGAEAEAFQKSLRDKPTPEMIKEAREYAKSVSYQMEPDEASRGLGAFINWTPIGKGTRYEIKPIRVAVPFFKTILNVAKANAKLSPAGLPVAAYKLYKGKITPGQAVAHTAMGLIPTAIGVAMAENGLITGPIPKDSAEREAFFASGKRPWTIRVGDKAIPLSWAGPFALSLGLGAAIKEAESQQKKGDIPKGASELYAAAAGNAFKLFMDGSPVITLNSVLDAITEPNERTWKALASNVGSSLVPLVSLQGFFNRQDIETLGLNKLRDPKLRDKAGETAFEEIMNAITDRTLFSRTLPERINSLGKTIDRPGQLTPNLADPVYSELSRLGVKVSMPSKSFNNKRTGETEKFTPEEYRRVLRAGEPVYQRLLQIVNSGSSDQQKTARINAVLDSLLQSRRKAEKSRIQRERASVRLP